MPKRSEEVQYKELHGQVFPLLAGAVDGGTVLSMAEQAHAETCLNCQAELLRYRRMLRTLHDLRTTIIRPAPGLLAEILENLAERGEQRAIRSLSYGSSSGLCQRNRGGYGGRSYGCGDSGRSKPQAGYQKSGLNFTQALGVVLGH